MFGGSRLATLLVAVAKAVGRAEIAPPPNVGGAVDCLRTLSDGNFAVQFTRQPGATEAPCSRQLSWTVHGAHDCAISRFSASHFIQVMAGRTLFMVGDSLMRQLYAELCGLLKPFSVTKIANVTNSDDYHGKGGLQIGCQAYMSAVIVCFCAAAFRSVDPNMDLFSRAGPGLLRHTLTSSDIVVWNMGVHYGQDPDSLRQYADLVEHVVADWAPDAAGLPQLWWRETMAQHFEHSVWEGKVEHGCHDIAGMTANFANTTGPYNDASAPIIRRFGLVTVRTYRESVPLVYAHRPHDCTHYCEGDMGPDRFDAELLLTMLKADQSQRVARGADAPSTAAGALARRWQRILEAPDSIVGRMQDCGSELLVRTWHEPQGGRGALPCALVKCMRVGLSLLQYEELSMRHIDPTCHGPEWQPPLRTKLSQRYRTVTVSWPTRLSCKAPRGLCGVLGIASIDGKRVMLAIAASTLVGVAVLCRFVSQCRRRRRAEVDCATREPLVKGGLQRGAT